MKKASKIRLVVMSLFLFSLLQVLFPLHSRSMTNYYIDPDWGGPTLGSSSAPWTSLTGSAWSTINSALASDNVTVYFSAREASSDTDEVYTDRINFSSFTNPGTNRLTLDGMSKYNTNDSTPSWSAYSGTSKLKIDGEYITTGTTTVDDPKNYVTIKGFKVYAGAGRQGIFMIDAHDWIVRDNYVTHKVGATLGPGILVTLASKTSAAAAAATVSTNVQILDNKIENNYGEAIYVSGCKHFFQACDATPDNILIQGNTITNAGARGGEGDGVDIKNFCTNCVVKNNIIISAAVAGIATHSGIVADGNYIVNAGDQGIIMADRAQDPFVYDFQDLAYDSGSIRNNIIINSGSNGIHIRSRAGNYDFRNIKIHNNTIYDAGGTGIWVSEDVTNVEIKNNIVSESAGTEFMADTGTLVAHDYNDLYDTSGNVYRYGTTTVAYNGNITTVEPNSTISDPQFLSASTPYAVQNFKLESASPAIDAGTSMISFIDDYLGNTRGVDWDMGAFEYGVEVNPNPPTGLQVN